MHCLDFLFLEREKYEGNDRLMVGFRSIFYDWFLCKGIGMSLSCIYWFLIEKDIFYWQKLWTEFSVDF